ARVNRESDCGPVASCRIRLESNWNDTFYEPRAAVLLHESLVDERRESPGRLVHVERHPQPDGPAALERVDDARMNRQRHAQRIVLDHGKEPETERPRVARLHRDAHREANREVVGDRRRFPADVIEQGEEGADMTAKAILGAGGPGGSNQRHERQAANHYTTRSTAHRQRPFICASQRARVPAGTPTGWWYPLPSCQPGTPP